VDAPELPTDEGEEAKAWVEERLNHVAFVVMTTTKVGMYGRYIADVFYPPSRSLRGTGRRMGGGYKVENIAAKGRYLNGEMVEAGMAIRA
jgi:endonuclease YncB( thermonuclease family)